MDTEYLKANVGSVLAEGLSQTVLMRPDDPIGYLAQYLLRSEADKAAAAENAAAAAEMLKAEGVKKDAARVAEREAENIAKKSAKAKETRDAALAEKLGSASTSAQVYELVLAHVAGVTGGSAYVAKTDLPEKEAAAAAPEAPAEAAAEGEGEGGDAAPAEPAPAKPKFKPNQLTYIAAAGAADQEILVGKTLARAEVAPAEEEDAPPPPPPAGSGVSFAAIDAFLESGAKSFHVASAITNPLVKFWHIPRAGDFAAAPIADADGDVAALLAVDTLAAGGALDADLIAEIEAAAAAAASALPAAVAAEKAAAEEAAAAAAAAEAAAAAAAGS